MVYLNSKIKVSYASEAVQAVHPSIAFVSPKSVYVFCHTQDGSILYFNYLHESFYVSEKQFIQVLSEYNINHVKINPMAVNLQVMEELVRKTKGDESLKVIPLSTKRISQVAPNTAIITLLEPLMVAGKSTVLIHILVDNMISVRLQPKHLEQYLLEQQVTTLFVDTRYCDISDVENLLNLSLEPIEEPPVREKRIGGYRFNRCFNDLDFTTAKGLKVFIHSIQYGVVYFSNKRGEENNLTIGAFYNWLKDNSASTIHIHSDLDIDEVSVLLDIHD